MRGSRPGLASSEVCPSSPPCAPNAQGGRNAGFFNALYCAPRFFFWGGVPCPPPPCLRHSSLSLLILSDRRSLLDLDRSVALGIHCEEMMRNAACSWPLPFLEWGPSGIFSSASLHRSRPPCGVMIGNVTKGEEVSRACHRGSLLNLDVCTKPAVTGSLYTSSDLLGDDPERKAVQDKSQTIAQYAREQRS